MNRIGKVKAVWKSKPTLEGAGVHLRRAFGFSQDPTMVDPFLLLDDFRSRNPEEYVKGFPWHPHRGMETITYMLDGSVIHGDSMGNSGEIGAGDVQWMTAGSGIIHQEMPKGDAAGKMGGFQLWANLPAAAKMTTPRYQEIRRHQIPVVTLESGVRIRIICGIVAGERGPVREIVIDPEYLDIEIPPHTDFRHPVKRGHTVLAYIFHGKLVLPSEKPIRVEDGTLIAFEAGDEAAFVTDNESARFLLISGKPIKEPIAWQGPIVMNTEEELRIAFTEYRNGTFIKPPPMIRSDERP